MSVLLYTVHSLSVINKLPTLLLIALFHVIYKLYIVSDFLYFEENRKRITEVERYKLHRTKLFFVVIL